MCSEIVWCSAGAKTALQWQYGHRGVCVVISAPCGYIYFGGVIKETLHSFRWKVGRCFFIYETFPKRTDESCRVDITSKVKISKYLHSNCQPKS